MLKEYNFYTLLNIHSIFSGARERKETMPFSNHETANNQLILFQYRICIKEDYNSTSSTLSNAVAGYTCRILRNHCF